MAMPADAERAGSVHDYRRTCVDFVQDISKDYKAWVDYYKLPPAEDARRRRGIDGALDKSCMWLTRIPQTIKATDIVMNDCIQKMAEATAGRPFQIGVFVDGTAGYTSAKPGKIPVRIRAAGREGRRTRLGYHFQHNRFRIESTSPVTISGDISDTEYDNIDMYLYVCAQDAHPGDIISFTITVCEMHEGMETERRGLTTIIHIT